MSGRGLDNSNGAAPFDLRLLEPFVVLAHELHFGRAAVRLGLSQPALSQQIQRLESQLGGTLFLRSSRTVALSELGAAVLGDAREAVAACMRIEATLGLARPTLRVGLSGNIDTFVEERLDRFAGSHPEIEVVSVHSVERELRRRMVDFDLILLTGGLRPPAWGAPFMVRSLGVVRAGLVMVDDHPLAATARVDLSALGEETLLMFERELGPSAFDAIIGAFPANRRPTIVERPIGGTRAQRAMQEMVRGGGITVNLQRVFAQHAPTGLVIQPTDPPMRLGLWAILRPGAPAVEALVEGLSGAGDEEQHGGGEAVAAPQRPAGEAAGVEAVR